MTHTDTQDTLYMHLLSGEVWTLSDLLDADFSKEYKDIKDSAREAYAEYHTEEETSAAYPDTPTPSQAEIIDEYMRTWYLIEVRPTVTDEEREEYGDWMDA